MSIQVRVDSRIPMVVALVHGRVETAIRKAAFTIEAEAKMRAPVDTGNLRNSIHATGSGTDWRVNSPAEYALYVEFGTHKMAARPHLIPALEVGRRDLANDMRNLA